jgi:hypothetical protein
VLPHQLQELMVLAGLDPAAGFVVKLMGLLQERIARSAAAAGSTADARLHLDEFLGVACFFRQQPLEVLQHKQVQRAAAEAAAREAAAAAVEEHGEGDEQQQHEGGQEEWQEHEEGGETEADAAAEDAAVAEASSEPVWGAATDEDMLSVTLSSTEAGERQQLQHQQQICNSLNLQWVARLDQGRLNWRQYSQRQLKQQQQQQRVCSAEDEMSAAAIATAVCDAGLVNQQHDGGDASLVEGAEAHAEDQGATGGAEADGCAAASCFSGEAEDVGQESAAAMPEETEATAEVNAETGSSSAEEPTRDTDA